MANIVFVDEDDNVIGAGTKAEAWVSGARHRIVRIFVLNSRGEILLARRGLGLASLPGRWNESAAGHVDEDEDYGDAALRELEEELGVSDTPLKEIARFKSEETDEQDKKKNRWTKVFIAHHNGPFVTSEREVSEIKWITPTELKIWVDRAPGDFTEGFILGFQMLIDKGIVAL